MASVRDNNENGETLDPNLAPRESSLHPLHPCPDLVIETDASRTGWGAVYQGGANYRLVVSNGAETTHQLSGASGRIICVEELHQGSIMCPCDTSHGQHFSSRLCEPSSGDSLPSSIQPVSSSLGIGSPGTSTTRATGGCVSGVSRFDVASRAMCQRSFRGQTECPIASVFQLEARPNSDCHGYSSTGLVARQKLCISPVLHDNAITSEDEVTRGRVDTSDSFVANPSLVP